MSNRIPDAEVLLTPKEVAQRFHVNPKTVTRWAKAGKLTAIRTLGGHRRYRESEVLERLREYKESSSQFVRRQTQLMADKNDDMKARMLAALEAKKNKPGAPGTQTHSESGSKIRGGQRSGGAPQVQRKAGPSGSGSAG